MAKQIINIGQSVNDKSGDPLRTAFDKVNQNFTELYATTGADNPPDRLINGASEVVLSDNGYLNLPGGTAFIVAEENNVSIGANGEPGSSSLELSRLGGARLVSQVDLGLLAGGGAQHWAFGTDGSLTVPSPTTEVFTFTFSASNYVPTQGKPTLTLTDDPWELHGGYAYSYDGRADLALDSIFPTLINPGYESGDSFTFDETVHGIAGFVLTLTLNDVVLPGGAGWTANVSESSPPVYPSTVKSSGAIKLTAATNVDWIFGADGKLTIPPYGDIVDSNGDTVLGGGGASVDLSAVAQNIVPSADLQYNLGSPSHKWHSLYVGTGSIYVGDAVLSLEGGKLASSVGFAGSLTTSKTITGVTGFIVDSTPVTTYTFPTQVYGPYTIATLESYETGDFNQHTPATYSYTLDADGYIETITLTDPGSDYELQAGDIRFIGFNVIQSELEPVRLVEVASIVLYDVSDWTNGTYTASATLGGQTVTVTYTVSSMQNPTQFANKEVVANSFTSSGLLEAGTLSFTSLYIAKNSPTVIRTTETFNDDVRFFFASQLGVVPQYEYVVGNITSQTEFNGSYTDLADAPVIPTDISDLTDAGGLLSGGASTGNIRFTANTMYDLSGIIIENSDLSHGPTAALILPTNSNTLTPIQLNNLYGDITLQASSTGGGGLKTWEFGGDGILTLPDRGSITMTGGSIGWSSSDDVHFNLILNSENNVAIQSNTATTWTFGTDGTLTFPDSLTVTNGVIGKATTDTTVVEDIAGTTTSTYTVESQIEIETTGIVIAKRTIETVDDGVVTATDSTGSVIELTQSNASIKHYLEPAGPNNTVYSQFTTDGGSAVIETIEEDVGGTAYGRVNATVGSVDVFAKDTIGSGKQWRFDNDGSLILPPGGNVSAPATPYSDLVEIETIYNNLEVTYQDALTEWMTIESFRPVWYALPGRTAYDLMIAWTPTTGQPELPSNLPPVAKAAKDAYAEWQYAISISALKVKSDTTSFEFDSSGKLKLPQGGTIAGGDLTAVQAAYDAWQATEDDWTYLITTGGTHLDPKPWTYAAPDQRQSTLTSMWQVQQQGGIAIDWTPISQAFYAEVRNWLAVSTNSVDLYDEWKKLSTSVNIASEDSTWTFTKDGTLTLPDGLATLSVDSTTGFNINILDLTGTLPLLTWNFDRNGYLNVPGVIGFNDNGIQRGSMSATTNSVQIVAGDGNGIDLWTNDGGAHWAFGTNGNITFPDASVQTTAFVGTGNLSFDGNNIVVDTRQITNHTYDLTQKGPRWYIDGMSGKKYFLLNSSASSVYQNFVSGMTVTAWDNAGGMKGTQRTFTLSTNMVFSISVMAGSYVAETVETPAGMGDLYERELNTSISSGALANYTFNDQGEFTTNTITATSIDTAELLINGQAPPILTVNQDGSRSIVIDTRQSTSELIISGPGESFVATGGVFSYYTMGPSASIDINKLVTGVSVSLTDTMANQTVVFVLTSNLTSIGGNTWTANYTQISGDFSSPRTRSRVTITTTTGGLADYNFSDNGSLTFPDDTVQSTAFQDVPSHIFFVHPNPGRTFTQTGTYNSPFDTITKAITAAVTAGHSDADPATIILMANITENITMAPGVYLTSLGTGTHGSPYIIGTVTVTSSTGTVSSNHYSISNLRIIAPGSSGHCILFTGSTPQKLFLRDMWLDAKNTYAGLYMDNSGAGSTVQMDTAHMTHSGSGDIYCINVIKGGCYVTDIETSGATQVAAVQDGAVLTIDSSELDANGDVVCETYGSGSITITNSSINNSKANSTGVLLNDAAGVATIGNCLFNIPFGAGYSVQGVSGSHLYTANNVFLTANLYRSSALTQTALPATWLTKA